MLGINMMHYTNSTSVAKQRKSLSLDSKLIAEAQKLNINLAEAAETGINIAIAIEKQPKPKN